MPVGNNADHRRIDPLGAATDPIPFDANAHRKDNSIGREKKTAHRVTEKAVYCSF